MRITEIELREPAALQVSGKQFAVAKRQDRQVPGDCLNIRFANGVLLELSSAIDISEQLDEARIFLVEGKHDNTFVLFGGEQAYWISTDGKVDKRLQTFRRFEDAEYWVTQAIVRADDVVIIYEAGVLVLDEDLNVKCHKKKYFNDFFVSIEGDSIKFLQDHEDEWYMRLDDGDSDSKALNHPPHPH